MDVKALIVEMLDADGTLRTFRMEPNYNRSLIVAFADEYDEPRSGPFHFLDEEYARDFERGFARAHARKVGRRRFYQEEGYYHFKTSWAGMPTVRHSSSYYALSLPVYAVPKVIRATDPHSGRSYRKDINRDDQRSRFVVYLECRSSRGIFDFDIEAEFRIDPIGFASAEYSDDHSSSGSYNIDHCKWEYLGLGLKEGSRVQQFFAERIHVGDIYKVGQAGAVGPGATAHDMTLNQIGGHIEATMSLSELAGELSKLRQAMSERATETEHHIAIGDIAKAEKAAKESDASKVALRLKSAGKWALEVASKVGVPLAVEAMKQATGMK
jgi:hypothetical protein